MRIIYFLLLIIISKNSLAQPESKIRNARDELNYILSNAAGVGSPCVFVSDIETIDTIIKQTKSKYKIVYSFSMSCHSSLEVFPAMSDFVNKNKDFTLYPIYGYRDIDTALVKLYLKEYNFHGSLFMLDTEKYGKKRNPSSRIRKLTQRICEVCEYKKMGFSSFYVFDENNRVVHHNTWVTVGLDKMKRLEEWYCAQDQP